MANIKITGPSIWAQLLHGEAFVSGNAANAGHPIIQPLNSNEMLHGHPSIIDAAVKRLQTHISVYVPPSADGLRAAVAKHYNISPECVLQDLGGEGFILRFPAITNRLSSSRPGMIGEYEMKAACAQVGYGRYEPSSRYLGKPFAFFKQLFSRFGDYVLVDPQYRKYNQFIRQHNVDLVYFCQPQNPLGTFHNQDQLIHTLRNLPKHMIAVVDTAYTRFSGEKYINELVHLAVNSPNIVAVETLSKEAGMAGAEAAVAISGNPNILKALRKVQVLFPMQQAGDAGAIKAFEIMPELQGIANKYGALRERLKDMTASSGLKVLVGDESKLGNNFFTFLCPDPKLAPYHSPLWAQNVLQRFSDAGFPLRWLNQYNQRNLVRITVPHFDYEGQVMGIVEELGKARDALPRRLNWSNFRLPGAMLVAGVVAAGAALWASLRKQGVQAA